MPEPSMLQVVLMGLITVFIALICLIIIIVILGKIMVAVTGNKTVETTQAPAPAPVQAAPAAWQPSGGGCHCGRHCGGHGRGCGPHPYPVHPPGVTPTEKKMETQKFIWNREGINYEKVQCQCQRHCL